MGTTSRGCSTGGSLGSAFAGAGLVPVYFLVLFHQSDVPCLLGDSGLLGVQLAEVRLLCSLLGPLSKQCVTLECPVDVSEPTLPPNEVRDIILGGRGNDILLAVHCAEQAGDGVVDAPPLVSLGLLLGLLSRR